MRLLQLAEVQKSTRDRVFRYSPERTLLLALVAVCASTALFLAVWREVSVLAYYIAGVLLFSTVVDASAYPCAFPVLQLVGADERRWRVNQVPFLPELSLASRRPYRRLHSIPGDPVRPSGA